MHPLLSAQLANAIMDERLRYADERRRAGRQRAQRSQRVRRTAPWPERWSAYQVKS
jgi:hypothetical protein